MSLLLGIYLCPWGPNLFVPVMTTHSCPPLMFVMFLTLLLGRPNLCPLISRVHHTILPPFYWPFSWALVLCTCFKDPFSKIYGLPSLGGVLFMSFVRISLQSFFSFVLYYFHFFITLMLRCYVKPKICLSLHKYSISYVMFPWGAQSYNAMRYFEVRALTGVILYQCILLSVAFQACIIVSQQLPFSSFQYNNV